MGWGVSGNAAAGHWQRGVPNGGGDRGDPPSDGDGSGQCYVTQNGPGDRDVDSGNTILTSPILDASGSSEATISYWRWYDNIHGIPPEQDIFVVEISNNGGASWVNLETVGPAGPEVRGGWFQKKFRISDFVAPTNQLRVRFIASDTDPQSVVEAGVDGVRIQEIDCEGGPVCADSGILIEGTNELNDFNAACGSDDNRWGAQGETFVFQITDPVVQFELSATSFTGSPNSISIDVEASKQTTGANLNLRSMLYNFDTGAYVAMPGILPLGTSDAAQTFNLPLGANPADFVDPSTNEVRLLLQTIQTSGASNVRTRLDDVVFVVN